MRNVVLENMFIGRTADGMAETTDNLPEETYLYLWNEIVKDGTGETEILKVWDTIPVIHQDNLIEASASPVKMKENELDENNRVEMYKLLQRDPWDDTVRDEIEGYLLKVKNNGVESREFYETEGEAYNKHFDHFLEMEENVKQKLSSSNKNRLR